MAQAAERIDTILQVAGGLVLAIWFLRLSRAGRLRNPLASGADLASSREDVLILTGLGAFFYFIAPSIAVLTLMGSGAFEQVTPSGSDSWYARLASWSIGQALVIPLLVWLLRQEPLAGRERRRVSVGVMLTTACGATLVALMLSLTQLAATMALLEANGFDPPPQHEILEAARGNARTVAGAGLLILSAVIVAPIVEELFFRGVLLRGLWRFGGRAWPAIIASAGLFAVVHQHVPQSMAPLFTFGIVLGYVRVRTGSMLVCILAHIAFNARTMTLVFVAPDQLG